MTKLQPQLRFPEFEGDWEVKKLGEITNKVMYGMNSSAIPFDGTNKYLRITDIDENTREFNPNPLTSPDGNIEDKYKLKEGDIVFARTGASVGKSYLYKTIDGNLLFAGFLIKFSIINQNPYFIYSQTLKNSFGRWVQLMSMRSGQPGINAEEFKTLNISLTSLPEQTKIANFLTAINEKIQALQKKKTLLEQYKKGLMQQIFNQELRFKQDDGSDFPDWEERTLGEVGEIITGKTPNTSDLSLWRGDIQFITPTDIKDGEKYQIETERLVSEFRNIKILPFKSILFTCIASIGKMCLSVKPCITNQQINSLIPFDNYENEFLYYSILYITPKIKATQANTTLPIINKTQFSKFKIAIPKVREEQHKISNFLSGIDEKINKVSQQIEYTQTYKKGLLQQMFC